MTAASVGGRPSGLGQDVKRTWYGDADFNGEFNSSDFVQVFQAGKYEQGWLTESGWAVGALAGWSEGDWNGDGLFDSSDFITAFQDGGTNGNA